MSLLSGFDFSLPEVGFFAQAARAASAGGPAPTGWTVITPAQLGLSSQYWDGNHFTDPNSGASAIVLQHDGNFVVSFRGTDSSTDAAHFPELLTGTYIEHYRPLLTALAVNSPVDANFAFTGASLGGAATNQMANIATADYGGRFASADFVAFASPLIVDKLGILNIGFENDPVYKLLSGYADSPSSLDNFVLATSEYMAGNYDGQHPPSDYAHNGALSFAAFDRLSQSVLLDQMNPDSVLIFDSSAGSVRDITPGRANTGAFYLGESGDDFLFGNSGGDFFEGFGGADFMSGGAGNDVLLGGAGNDVLYGDTGNDRLLGNAGGDQMLGGAGFDSFFWVSGEGSDYIDGGSEFDGVFFNRALTELTFIGKVGDLITAQFEGEYIYMRNVEGLQFTDQTLFV